MGVQRITLRACALCVLVGVALGQVCENKDGCDVGDGPVDCGDPSTPPWTTECQAELPPSERWIYGGRGRFVTVNGLSMHYVDIGKDSTPGGEDRVYLFLHGQPTWGYLWRNIAKFVGGCNESDFSELEDACDGGDIPGVARAVMVDYVGFGRSDKPEIRFDDAGDTVFNYTISSHIDQIEGFIDELGLGTENGGPKLMLVTHDWGGGIGVGYLGRRPANVAGFACFECYMFELPYDLLWNGSESVVARTVWGGFFEKYNGYYGFFDRFRTMQSYDGTFKKSLFLDVIKPVTVPGNLSDAELRFYSFPFRRPQDRWGMFHFPFQVILGKGTYPNGTAIGPTEPTLASIWDYPAGTVFPSPSEVWFELQRGRSILFNSPTPKLLLTGTECFITPTGSPQEEFLVALSSPFPESLTGPISIGLARHFGQEDQPFNIAKAIVDWDSKLFDKNDRE